MELAQQIKADFEESFQGPNAKVRLTVLLFIWWDLLIGQLHG